MFVLGTWQALGTEQQADPTGMVRMGDTAVLCLGGFLAAQPRVGFSGRKTIHGAPNLSLKKAAGGKKKERKQTGGPADRGRKSTEGDKGGASAFCSSDSTRGSSAGKLPDQIPRTHPSLTRRLGTPSVSPAPEHPPQPDQPPGTHPTLINSRESTPS